jgi:hypothetical protein
LLALLASGADGVRRHGRKLRPSARADLPAPGTDGPPVS